LICCSICIRGAVRLIYCSICNRNAMAGFAVPSGGGIFVESMLILWASPGGAASPGICRSDGACEFILDAILQRCRASGAAADPDSATQHPLSGAVDLLFHLQPWRDPGVRSPIRGGIFVVSMPIMRASPGGATSPGICRSDGACEFILHAILQRCRASGAVADSSSATRRTGRNDRTR